MANEICLATFYTTHAALKAEKVLCEASIAAKLIPTPRHLSADCTLAISYPFDDADRVRLLLLEQAIKIDSYYNLPQEDKF